MKDCYQVMLVVVSGNHNNAVSHLQLSRIDVTIGRGRMSYKRYPLHK